MRLTAEGRRQFATMAREHEAWLTSMFEGCAPGTKESLYEMLGRLRVHLARPGPDPDRDHASKSTLSNRTRKG